MTYLHRTLSIAPLLLALCVAAPAAGQLLEDEPVTGPTTYGDAVVGRFQVGAEITASRGACRDVQAMVAVPLECAEQQVRIVEEDFTSDVQSVTYRDVPGGEARQMLITIPYLPAKAEARAVVTFEVSTRKVLPPEDTAAAELVIPRRPPRDLRRYAAVSPFIEAKDRRIRKIAREQLAELPEGATDWQRIERLYDYVLDNIEYAEGPDTSAVHTLREGYADCHGRSALFIALCRSIGAPARVVWVNHHVYAEFYLEDADGAGSWFPAESAGSRAFGEMPLARVILQKGDNFRVPERPKDRLRYATDFVYVPPGKGKPSVRFLREQL
ncbi:MAG: transglutaminase-like domain-containing protein [Planctomycetota bacterium]